MDALDLSSGMVPDYSDWLKRAVRHGASSTESSPRTLFGILSGPEALWGLSCDSSLRTPVSWAVTLPILVLLGPNQGMKEVSSRVKTLWNSLIKMRALSLAAE